MQSSGQYGVTEVPQFVVGGNQHPPHIFSLAHDMSLSPPSGHGHPGHHQQHLYSHHQQQQPKEPQLHHHHTHQPQASHSPHQQRQQHQHMQQQQVVQQQVHQTLQQQHHQQQPVQQQQQQMVHQLGLDGPDSPEAPPSPVASRPSPTGFAKQMRAVPVRDLALGHEAVQGHDDDGTEGEEGRSTGANRWPRQETLLLIKIRSEMDSNFRDSGLKGPLWEDVARKLSEHGYHRSAKKCKEKFENIHKYYKKTKDGKAGRQDGKNYRFFSELDALYSGRNASTQCADAAASLLLPGLVEHHHGGVMADDAVTPSAFRLAENASGFAVSDSSEENHDERERDSDDDDDDNNNNRSKKRKRRLKESGAVAAAAAAGVTSSTKVMFLESLVKKLMDKQEAMQRKFLESMERREQDRMAREESWKRQEMERMSREHELRIQEYNLAATRDAALIAVLQKVTGQTLHLPQLPAHPPPPLPPALQHAATIEVPRNQILHQKQQQQEEQQQLLQNPQDEPDKDGSFDPQSKRWPTPEVHALIRLRIEMESRFQETGAKGPLWEEISKGMSSMGYSRNSKRCKEKWENVNKYYRKTKESNKKRSEKSKTCPYFQQLEALYQHDNNAATTTLGTLAAGSNLPSKSVDEQDLTSQEVVLVPDLQQEDHRDHHHHDQSREFAQRDTTANTEVVQQLSAAAAGMDAPGPGADGGSAGNGAAAAAHLFSSPENGSSGDPGGGSITKKVKLKHR